MNWLHLPVDIYMSFYIFNLTNGYDFEKKGAKPIFEEIGPIVYRETRIKEDIVDNMNYTISYKERRLFHYVPEMSSINDKERVTSLNLVAITLIDLVKNMPGIDHTIINLALKLAGETLLVKQPIHDLLFGYNDTLLTIVSDLDKQLVPNGIVSFFYNVIQVFSSKFILNFRKFPFFFFRKMTRLKVNLQCSPVVTVSKNWANLSE
jgi:hypothetical protein